MRGHSPEHAGLRVFVLHLRRLDGSSFSRPSSLVLNVNIVELDVFDRGARNTAEDGAPTCFGIGADNVADHDAPQHSNGYATRTAHAAAQAEENGGRNDVAHCYVRDGDVFEQPSIHGFQRQAITALEDAIGNRDVLEAAVRRGAEFDAAVPVDLGTGGVEALEAAVE